MTTRPSNAESPAVRIATLGCKVNQADSADLAHHLAQHGCHVTDRRQPAAACVVNTCTVTRVADAKARKLIRRLIRDHPGAVVVVTGCGARCAPDLGRIPGVTRVVPGGDPKQAAEVTAALLSQAARPAERAKPSRPQQRARPDPVEGSRPPSAVRAFVKVQDGCDHRCTYCIVPDARGPVRSLGMEQALERMRDLAAAGARELVLCGIRLGAYGEEARGRGLARLLHGARDLPVARLRLSSIEPWDVGEELIAEIAGNPLLCPHLHLPLQSGDDGVLRAMGRPYTASAYRALVRRLREALPDIALTTDIMVGFPGESQAAFEATCEAVAAVGFGRCHVFRYSPRPGTPAAQMPGQVREGTKSARTAHMQAIARQAAHRYASGFVGRVVPVLIEECAQGACRGLTDTYLRVRAPGDDSLVGEVAGVLVAGVEDGCITGPITRR